MTCLVPWDGLYECEYELWDQLHDARDAELEQENEQIAWESLVADGRTIQVKDAAGVMADMLAAIEMGAHDDHPW